MKKQSFLLFLIASMNAFVLIQCSCVKPIFQKNPPFTITESHFQEWIGGQPGVSGTSVHILLSTIDENVQPDSLFFNQSKAKIDIKTAEKGYLWVANFRKSAPRDINMHSEPKEEYGNTPPKMEVFPFELARDEAVISYYTKGKKAYYKIIGLQKKETLFFPSANPRD